MSVANRETTLTETVSRTRVETASAARHEYTILMGGTLDGVNTREPIGYRAYQQEFEPNVHLRMENVGNEAVVNPWIIVNDARDFRSLDRILAGIIRDDMTDCQKAHAIWKFACSQRYHYTTGDDEVKDTVKMLNCYGYTLCWDEAYTVANLWQTAGLRIRRGYPHGHCTTEVWYDDSWHLMDSDEHLLVLKRDNRTVASEEDIARDHDLLKRSHCYSVLHEENRQISEGAASLFFHTGPRPGGREIIAGHTMNLILRPGEALIWEWEDRGRFHGTWEKPIRIANGRHRFAPKLSDERWHEQTENLQPNGESLCSGEAEGSVVYRVRAPYVMVGGSIELKTDGAVLVDFSIDGVVWSEIDARGLLEFSLRDRLPAAPACHGYYLRFRLAPGTTLHRAVIQTDLQMAPLSLPELRLGENKIVYTSDTEGPQSLRLEHEWGERDAGPAPAAPERPITPAHDAHVEGTRIAFQWSPSTGAVDYHIQISRDADLRGVISPVFDKISSRTPSQGRPEWTVPHEGLLNPGESYYWRVRSRERKGRWSEWSDIWSFVPQAPGVPLDLSVSTDWESRTVSLSWAANPNGDPPDRYEIYGSDERGFTASAEPYEVVSGQNDAVDTFRPNLLTVTQDTSIVVAGADVAEGTGNRGFYRVVAVSGDGIRSGPSDLAEAPRPMIVSDPPAQTAAGTITRYSINCLRSIGDLRCERKGEQNYISAFRDADRLRFLLDEGPGFLSIDETEGILLIAPEPTDAGTHTITLRVQNGQGGVDMQGFDLKVTI